MMQKSVFRKPFPLLILWGLLSFLSCTKEPEKADLTIKPEYRGLYVDDFMNVLGDTVQENHLLSWVLKNNFKNIALYSLPTALSSEKTKKQLASFIERARTDYGVKDVGACLASAERFYTQVNPYNDSVPDIQKLNYTNLELEWWNNESTYAEYLDELKGISTWASLQSYVTTRETYIGWFRNPYGEELTMASDLLEYTDRILIHDYESVPSFAYIKERVNWIGKAARDKGVIAKLVVIFETNKLYSFNYFRSHSFDEAYSKVLQEYIANNFEGKPYVKFIGYQLFAQSSARLARP